MRNKQFVSVLIATLISTISVCFVSCSKDDENGNSSTEDGVLVFTGEASAITANSVTISGSNYGKCSETGILLGTLYSLSISNCIKKVVVSNNASYFTETITGLESNTKYYYCVYSLFNGKYYYGNVKFFETTGKEAVDLGLPSGRKWANMNVGAERPEDYGLYFAWGETVGYTSNLSDDRTFDWNSYKWCYSWNRMTKYCYNYPNINFGTPDNITTLEFSDDAARKLWGETWRIPSFSEVKELWENTTIEWVTINGVEGMKFTSKKNNRYIFLPGAGYRDEDSFETTYLSSGTAGFYWCNKIVNSESNRAYSFRVDKYMIQESHYYRCLGLTIRPVK